MRLSELRAALHEFCTEAAWQLAADTHDGHEVPFEVVEEGRRDAPLYCYRPLTGDFIHERRGVLSRLPAYLPAAHRLSGAGRLDVWLESQGVHAASGRERADAGLHCFLAGVFEGSTDFVLSEERFDRAFRELETVLVDGRTETVVVAALLGVELHSEEVPVGEGLALVRADAAEELPEEVLRAVAEGGPRTLVVLRWEPAPGDEAPLGQARVRLRRLLVGLRLYDAVPVSLAPMAWTRTAAGPWHPFALGVAAAGDGPLEILPEQEDELRAFLSLVARRTPRHGEIAWALRRFELATERAAPAEALTDLLLALRAVLEPEGPVSGRLAGRVAALCAEPHDRARLAERVAHTVSLERAVVTGLAVDPQLERLVAELAGHLRALLRDVLCGHLEPDLVGLADLILAEDAGLAPAPEPPVAAAAPRPAPAPPARPRAAAPARQDTFF